jgi:uncharacterized membrane protein YjfL (UPF0719 family)
MGDLMNMTPTEALLACSLLVYMIVMVFVMWRAGRQTNSAAMAAAVGALMGMTSTIDLIRVRPDSFTLNMLRYLGIALLGCVGLITLWRSREKV